MTGGSPHPCWACGARSRSAICCSGSSRPAPRVRPSSIPGLRIRHTTIMCRAELAWRFLPRLRRWRCVFPLEAGSGQAPHNIAKLASERSRSGFSRAVTRSSPALAIPTPSSLSRSGASSLTSGAMKRPSLAISSLRARTLRARDFSGSLVATAGSRYPVTSGLQAPQVRKRRIRVRLRIRSRTSSGAATIVLWSCCRAARRHLIAVLRVVRSTRRASTAPLRSLATCTRRPRRTRCFQLACSPSRLPVSMMSEGVATELGRCRTRQ